MKTLVIVSHPQIDESGTQNFLKASFPQSDEVAWHELSADFKVDEERQLLLDYQRIIFQFPLYWYSMPALFKKWVDEVFDGDFVFAGETPLANKELGLVVSTGIAQKQFQAGNGEAFTISEMLRPFEMMANKLGMNYLVPLMIYQFEYYTNEQKQGLVVEYQQYLMLKKFTFDDKLQWFIEELNQQEQTLLAESLAAKKVELENLSWQVQVMREDDGEG
ncbi:NAD(P)H-dependent oxidoreductase [Lactobacillus sp. YT155]|uniref:NAD(P)H-dependent oxidoreductase n=1 Tax=Lactobacillus sp. YT155 TaxID=3060955 RepID=UPI0026603D2A|nr:NAD(P)H-dependent oxidoreductase [Lactobacillus sp. YT155]MDO1605338.1 NAD(P)H-dependent oxidoreductase [Lactobacillus sp. YT155]